MQRRRFSTALAFSSIAAFMPLAGWAHLPSPQYQLGTLMQVSVIDRTTGRALPIHRHGGDCWVAGRPGARYAVRVRHPGGERIMAVMSVDGINIVTGESAGVLQNGYVFADGERSDIAGWRKSDSQIAAFEFTSVGQSYASRTGRPDDVGVIGVAMFRERLPLPPAPPVAFSEPQRETAAQASAADSASEMPAPGAQAKRGEAAAAPAQRLGTGHGRRETSVVSRTTFERAHAEPDEVVRIRYDSRENLIAAGIIAVPPSRSEGPSAFPRSAPGYVPDPPPRR